jgi:hypothetical protein
MKWSLMSLNVWISRVRPSLGSASSESAGMTSFHWLFQT